MYYGGHTGLAGCGRLSAVWHILRSAEALVLGYLKRWWSRICWKRRKINCICSVCGIGRPAYKGNNIPVSAGHKSYRKSTAYIMFLTAMTASVIDSALWGFTVDYLNFYQLFCHDLKDLYVDTAVGFLLLGMREDRKCE